MHVGHSTTSHLSVLDYSRAIQDYCQSHGKGAVQALRALSSISWSRGATTVHTSFSLTLDQAPRCGCIPSPRMQYAGAPAGKGLIKDPKGFPKGSIRTAGGYTVVPERGANAWSIYGPGKEMKDGANTRIWGDPHVNEKDGTRWDFTRNSNFRLPDGTLIYAKTTSQKGASVTKGLTIVNGADRINVDGIDVNNPQVSDVKHDGYEWRSQHLSNRPNRDTFVLGGNDKTVHWFKEKDGQVKGLITGSRVENSSFEQVLDKNKKFFVDPNLRPPVGSKAWGNQLRTGINDQIARSYLSGDLKNLLADYIGVDHKLAQTFGPGAAQIPLHTAWPGGGFGGLTHTFPQLGAAFAAIAGLGDEMLAAQSLALALQMNHRGITA